VRSHSTVVAPVAKSIRPPVVDHGLPHGELAPTWPGTPGGEEFPYSVKRPPKTYVRSAANLGARRHSAACTYPYSLGRCAQRDRSANHLSDDVGFVSHRCRHWRGGRSRIP
jgi:hypothetical protein